MPFAVVRGVPSKMLAEAGCPHCPQIRSRLLSEALQKPRGRFHRRPRHICEVLPGAGDAPRLVRNSDAWPR